jgi:mono/diheme cytochrome c family protein
MRRYGILLCCLGAMTGLISSAIAQEHAKTEKPSNTVSSVSQITANSVATHAGASPPPARDATTDERIARLEGEKRFRTNCGRCHQPPHKFPPRVMATAIRHMRVRAMITDEDMRLILRYMTE